MEDGEASGFSCTSRLTKSKGWPAGTCLAPARPFNVRVISPKPYHLLLPVRVDSRIRALGCKRDQTGTVNWDGCYPVCTACTGY
jgi:hypothetical protein